REVLVVALVVVPADALLRHPRGAAGLEDRERAAAEGARDPQLVWVGAQALAVEVRKTRHEIVEAADVAQRVEAAGLRVLEPHGRAGLARKMPAHDLAHVRVERGPRRGLAGRGARAHAKYFF